METSAALTYTELVETGVLTPMQMAEKMSYNPAKILGLKDRGSVSAGKKADIVVFDPRREYQIDVDTFAFQREKYTSLTDGKLREKSAVH